MMTSKLYMSAFIILLFGLTSLLSLYCYGRFAKSVQGTPSYALPADRIETTIDRLIAPLTEAHPKESGLMLLTDNLDAFAMRVLTARDAGRSLDLQYYIWQNDLTGNLIGHELLKAADRGVRVRLLLDDLNVHDKDTILAALNQHPNIEIRLFNPTRERKNSLYRGLEMLLRGFSTNRRMHNKAWIADGRIAIVGGRNIGDEYFNASSHSNFFDTDIMLTGPTVAEAARVFDTFWNSRSVIPLNALIKTNDITLENLRQKVTEENRLLNTSPYLTTLRQSPSVAALLSGKKTIHWTQQAHVYSDPPEKAYAQNKTNWLIQTLQPVWKQTQQRLYMISPYFVPGETGLNNLKALRAQGVEISILTNSLAATDVISVHGGYVPYRKPLLEAGINLYELMPHNQPEHSILGSSGASLHTKAFVADNTIGFVGSFNLDPRSVKLNTEMGVLFQEPSIATSLIQAFNQHTSSHSSYHLTIQNGALRWNDGSVSPPMLWNHEPETNIWQRLIAKVIEWLPVESQL